MPVSIVRSRGPLIDHAIFLSVSGCSAEVGEFGPGYYDIELNAPHSLTLSIIVSVSHY